MTDLTRSILPEEEIQKLKRYLKSRPKLIILTHANPDGDAIGSALGLYQGLLEAGFAPDVACIDPCPEEFIYLEHSDKLKLDFTPSDYEAVIFVDCGDKKLTRFETAHPEILSEKMVKINIDHHASNDNFGEINFVITDVASASMIVYQILKALDYKILPGTANALTTGIYTDTGGFMHQNTTPLTYQYAAELIKLGASPQHVAQNVFHKYDFRTLKLWGKVLQNLHITHDGAAIVGVEEKDYEALGCTRQDLAGVIDFINAMPEARYSVMLSEDGKGNVKASLRTRKDDVDVKALAEQYGGGGHVKASGFTIPGGRLEKEVKWKIVQD
jgi:phosphoesterase RecJ-like protein